MPPTTSVTTLHEPHEAVVDDESTRPVAIDVTADLRAALPAQVSPAEVAAVERMKAHRAAEKRAQEEAAERARRAIERRKR